MKKLLITLVFLALALSTNTSAFEALSSGGVGFITQSGEKATFAYSAGFGIPLLEKKASGFVLSQTITYIHSGGESDLQVLRTMSMASKTLWSGGPKGSTWKIAIEAGTGSWTFLNTEGSDSTYGALSAKVGGVWKGVGLNIATDIVMVQGTDIVAPFVGFSFDF